MNWKEFFSGNEFNDAIKESQKPIEKRTNIGKPVESDSEPSCDNFDEAELVERFEAAAGDDEGLKLPPKLKQKSNRQLEVIQKYITEQKIGNQKNQLPKIF